MTQLQPLRQRVDTAITTHDLSFSYPDRPHILQDVNLDVFPGERVGVIGPNGAGKTTLFLLMCGVLQPTSGQAFLFGHPVTAGRFRPDLGLVFQNPDDQLFSASVWDDIAFGPQNMGLPPTELEHRVAEALTLTGTQELSQRPPHHLSGGEKRMVAIASVLATHPQLIIYDEPSANLDFRARRRLIQFLQTSEQTMLISSHDLELILEVCDRVVLLDQGRIIADGKPVEIMNNQSLMEAHGLEKPYSLQLAWERRH
ncbi:MAG: energy-coupling factor ABC transporter ATP-binding protein [Cyanothece sp. SIO1E1]|nr:energy-coupling factor ABC transporter ATP-binding protein [Cyanothece sp. SIO1E1]